LQVGNRLKIK